MYSTLLCKKWTDPLRVDQSSDKTIGLANGGVALFCRRRVIERRYSASCTQWLFNYWNAPTDTYPHPLPAPPLCDRFALLADLTAAGWTTIQYVALQMGKRTLQKFLNTVLKNHFKNCCPLNSNGDPPPFVATVALSTSLYFGLI